MITVLILECKHIVQYRSIAISYMYPCIERECVEPVQDEWVWTGVAELKTIIVSPVHVLVVC